MSEKTGYPPEMLELDMELDSDLGIDSIKRVEIFSALQEKLPDAPAVGPEHLGTLRTLRQVATFLGQSNLERESPAQDMPCRSIQEAPPAVAAVVVDTGALNQTLLAVVSEKTGYHAEML